MFYEEFLEHLTNDPEFKRIWEEERLRAEEEEKLAIEKGLPAINSKDFSYNIAAKEF